MDLEEIVKEKKDNILKPLLVGELLKQEQGYPVYDFLIPSYQRGYRWDEEQVKDLLDDLFEFINTSKSRDEVYCLQPIVVKQLKDKRYEVLDGQQRLTTIFILLSRLKETNNEINLFSINYETRPDSADFLKNLNGEENDENPDYYFISRAYSIINSWLEETKNKKPNISTKLFDILVESVEFIWYEIVDDTDPIDVFTRINIGKIPLTNAELVKAVFLSKNNLSLGYTSQAVKDENFQRILSFKQNSIALEWDQMEKALQDPNFWGFIYSGSEEYETRIDFLLDLKSHKKTTEKNKYFSFKFFYDKVKEARNNKTLLDQLDRRNSSVIEQEWNSLKLDFNILLEWFNNKSYNHLVGFLISQNEKIVDLLEEFGDKSRKDFKEYLSFRIKQTINCTDISTLKYGKDNKKLERILLLHNVINSLQVKDNNIHFPFDRLKNKQWTLEHIFAQNSDDLNQDDYSEWLQDHLQFFKTKEEDKQVKQLINNIERLLSGNEKIDKDDFEECFLKVSSYIQNIIQAIDQDSSDVYSIEGEYFEEDHDWINEDHSIANLALLDGSINSAIKNSLFDIKRKMILEKDKEGLFIPSETKKVFLKYYTPHPNHLAYWTYADRKSYVENIKSSLNSL